MDFMGQRYLWAIVIFGIPVIFAGILTISITLRRMVHIAEAESYKKGLHRTMEAIRIPWAFSETISKTMIVGNKFWNRKFLEKTEEDHAILEVLFSELFVELQKRQHYSFGKTNLETYVEKYRGELFATLNFLEEVASGANQGLYDDDLVYRRLGYSIPLFYESVKLFIVKSRSEASSPLLYLDLEQMIGRWSERSSKENFGIKEGATHDAL